jgi:hypothetical protein
MILLVKTQDGTIIYPTRSSQDDRDVSSYRSCSTGRGMPQTRDLGALPSPIVASPLIEQRQPASGFKQRFSPVAAPSSPIQRRAEALCSTMTPRQVSRTGGLWWRK